MHRFDTVSGPPVALVRQDSGRWLSFGTPCAIVEAHDVNDVTAAIERVERQSRDNGLQCRRLAVLRKLVRHTVCAFQPTGSGCLSEGGAYTLDHLRPSVDREVFEAAFARVRTTWSTVIPTR